MHFIGYICPMPSVFYNQRLQTLYKERNLLRTKRRNFGILRLGTLGILILALYVLWNIGWWAILAALTVIIILFAKLVLKDLSNKQALDDNDRLIHINEKELNALKGEYFQFEAGTQYQHKDHPYSNDLDIFGHASLFQYLNRSITEPGNDKLAGLLKEAATLQLIKSRQQAIKELSQKPVWLQQFCCIGQRQKLTNATASTLENWMQEPTSFIQFRHWKWLRYLLPAMALLALAATIGGYFPLNAFYLVLFLMGVVAFQVNKELAPMHNKLTQVTNELNSIADVIALIEKENYEAPLLQKNYNQFNAGTAGAASKKIKALSSILHKMDMRYNLVMAAPLNLLLQWNLQQALNLEEWKAKNPSSIQNWLEALGEMDALCSLAILRFNHPQWAIPQFTETHFQLSAKNMGHPLIPHDKRVTNEMIIEGNDQIMLITGSNMAGKSTYLRSAGVNIVLAMAGAPVCATTFSLSPVHLLSSMRITDNLEENTSTFYAELKKLKFILENVNNREPVFILLDEILRGTNSFDRHTGSVALIKQFIKKTTPAVIATHDVALAGLEKEFPGNIKNYHFDVQVSGEELHFDYLLKPGICSSLNASLLMKKIGIEID